VRIAAPPEVSVPDTEPEPERVAPATGARMPEGGSRHTRSVEGLSVGNAWSGSALVSGFSARDESSAFIPGWDTPPVIANWSYYKRGWRNGSSATTDPVGPRTCSPVHAQSTRDLDHMSPSPSISRHLPPSPAISLYRHPSPSISLHQVWTDLDHVPPSRVASNRLEDKAMAVWAAKQILKRCGMVGWWMVGW
jgi:hypothetical protein